MECRCNQIQSSQKAKKYHKDMLFCFSPAFSGQDTAVTQVTSTMPKKQIDTDNSGPFMFDHLEPEWPSDPSGDGEPQTTVIFRPSYAALHHLQPFSRVGHTDAKTAAYQGYDISQDYNIRAKQNHSPSHISPTSSHFHHIFFCTNHIKSQPLSFTSPSPHP